MKYVDILPKHEGVYSKFVNNKVEATCMQMWEWVEFRNKLGGKLYDRAAVLDVSGEVSLTATYSVNRFKQLGNVLYIPQGPIWKDSNSLEIFTDNIIRTAKKKNCFLIVIDPRIQRNSEKHQELLKLAYKYTDEAVQPRVTIFLDLTLDNDKLLSSFSRTTRYNIRYAERKGVKIEKYNSPRDIAKIEEFYKILEETQKRKYFHVQSKKYFRELYKEFSKNGHITLYNATFKNEVLGSILCIYHDKWATSLFSASSGKHLNLKPMYLARWESIKDAKERGCEVYDFFGASKSDDKKHPFYHTTQHKLGFNKDFQEFSGTFEIILNPIKYILWKGLESVGLFKFYERSFLKEFRSKNANRKKT